VFGPVSFVRVCVCVVFVLFYISYILVLIIVFFCMYCRNTVALELLCLYCFCIVFCVECEVVWNYISVASSTSFSNHPLV